MTLLQSAGVDLSKPEPVRAVVAQLDTLVSRLEAAILIPAHPSAEAYTLRSRRSNVSVHGQRRTD